MTQNGGSIPPYDVAHEHTNAAPDDRNDGTDASAAPPQARAADTHFETCDLIGAHSHDARVGCPYIDERAGVGRTPSCACQHDGDLPRRGPPISDATEANRTGRAVTRSPLPDSRDRPHYLLVVTELPTPDERSLTELLAAAQQGDASVKDLAARRVYEELHHLAEIYLGRERPDHTLQPTALVNEAYLRLMGQEVPWKSRWHFFGIAATMMRRILVDHARRTAADRRDRGLLVTLDPATADSTPAAPDPVTDVLGVHEALTRLEQVDVRQAQIVELKFFVGLTLDEIAELLEISPATVSREWAMARAWLHAELRDP